MALEKLLNMSSILLQKRWGGNFFYQQGLKLVGAEGGGSYYTANE